MEVIRLDEEPVSKTGRGYVRCEFESHGLRFSKMLGTMPALGPQNNEVKMNIDESDIRSWASGSAVRAAAL